MPRQLWKGIVSKLRGFKNLSVTCRKWQFLLLNCSSGTLQISCMQHWRKRILRQFEMDFCNNREVLLCFCEALPKWGWYTDELGWSQQRGIVRLCTGSQRTGLLWMGWHQKSLHFVYRCVARTCPYLHKHETRVWKAKEKELNAAACMFHWVDRNLGSNVG